MKMTRPKFLIWQGKRLIGPRMPGEICRQAAEIWREIYLLLRRMTGYMSSMGSSSASLKKCSSMHLSGAILRPSRSPGSWIPQPAQNAQLSQWSLKFWNRSCSQQNDKFQTNIAATCFWKKRIWKLSMKRICCRSRFHKNRKLSMRFRLNLITLTTYSIQNLKISTYKLEQKDDQFSDKKSQISKT